MVVGLASRFVVVACLVFVLVAAARRPVNQRRPHQRPRGGRDSVDGRVPRDVLPYHYDIDITPDIYLPAPPFPFTGTVKISVECVVATRRITVNYYLITIGTVSIAVSPDSTVTPPTPVLESTTLEPEADFLHINVASDLVVGAKYTITIAYTGTLTNNGEGIYYDTYTAADGSTKYMLATQLEDIAARQMYPCMDEPDLKATFSVTVAHKPTVTSLSNMPVLRTEARNDDWIASIYDISPIMSTYQVCVCIGDLIYIEADWQGIVNYPIRVYGRPEIRDLLEFAANISAPTQRWLEIETGFVYNLPKMDHIAIPSKGGAMENWGLITYGEQYMPVNPETNSAYGTQYVISIVAHELAHQWYGNLVTAEWWTDIWLNEGFATYYDYYPLESIGWPGTYPQQLDTLYFMDADAKNTSDPVRKQIETTWDAWYSFAGSTYPKGGAMLRMLEGILSNPTLKGALTSYLTQFQYSSANTDDLWQVLTAYAASVGYNIDIKTIMDPWLNQMGFPLVTMTRNSDGTAVLTQKYFLHPPNQDINVASQWNYKWTIPITVVTSSSSEADWSARPYAWFDISETEKTLTGLPTSLNDWVLINARQLMYYRVNYDDFNRAAIVQQLITDHTKILPESRSSYIDDTFTLARASYITETTAMDATQYLGLERHYNPWFSTLKYTGLANRMLKSTGASWISNYSTYMLTILEPTYNALGWAYSPEETPDEQTLRRDVVAATCNNGHELCIENAQMDWVRYKQQPNVNSINPNNLPLSLCTGVSLGTGSDWNIVFDQYQLRRGTPIRDERNSYLYGLACSKDSATLDRLLTYIVGGVQIATRDQYRATLYLAMNPLGVDKVWNYFDNQWSTVPSGMSKFTVMRYITQIWADQASLDKLNAFITKNPPTSQSQWSSYNQMQLTVTQNIAWMNANQDSLRDWVIAHGTTATGSRSTFEFPVDPVAFWSTLRDEADEEAIRK